MLPNSVQTSPYITLVRPSESSPVVYMTDTLAPSYPDMGEPGAATFGVLGLDRKVVWRSQLEALTALETSAAEPVPTRQLVARFGLPIVSELVSNGWLRDPADLCTEYFLRTGQIEVTAHCNWGCSYCPVSIDPKPRATMTMRLFTEIIEKLSVYDTIKYVTFHFFNEPTLDRNFEERIRVLRDYGMKLSLATNASALTPDKVALLVESGVLHHLVVNLPTLNEQDFQELTGSRTYTPSLRNFENAVNAHSFPITIAVNGIGEAAERNVAELRNRYEPLGVEVNGTQTCDRAGTLENEYNQAVQVDGRLRGCSWPLNHAYFSVTGDMFICCNDYHQREIFGNIRDGSVHEIMTSPEAVGLRRRVFGVEQAPDDYICRTCHDQRLNFVHRQFRPPATFPLHVSGSPACGDTSCGCRS